MNDYTKYLTSRVTAGGLNRREFMGRAMAACVTLALADKLFTESAMAAEPKRGGHLKLGLEGGAATDSKDPAKFLSQVMFCIGRCWGDMLVESHPLTGAAVPSLAGKSSASNLGRAFVCEEAMCKAPTSDPKSLRQQILAGWRH